jgi:hypothetical protein
MEKLCPCCNKIKSTSDFRLNKVKKDGLQGYCIICDKAKQAEYYQRNKSWLKDKRRIQHLEIKRRNSQNVYRYLLEHPCIDCGENDPIVLEFDHLDRDLKIANISEMIGACFAWETIQNEISKCEVRCANCHRRKTAIQMNWSILKFVGGT